MTVQRPLNYYGSKQRMAPAIHRLIPHGPSTWVDVFCGSAIVTLSKPRHPREVINDLDGDIINLFEVLRSPRAGELFARIELTPYAEDVLRQAYDAPLATDPVERAWTFLVTSWFGRGGDAHRTGFRWSKSQTVSPELLWARLPDRLVGVAERLRGVCIRAACALKILDDYNTPDVVLFVDPPYPGPVGQRYRFRFTKAQHHQLADALANSRANVILTMAQGTLYQTALANWHRHPVPVVTCGGTTKTEEILTNFAPPPDLFGGIAA